MNTPQETWENRFDDMEHSFYMKSLHDDGFDVDWLEVKSFIAKVKDEAVAQERNTLLDEICEKVENRKTKDDERFFGACNAFNDGLSLAVLIIKSFKK